MNLVLIGVNHRTAPVDIRERLNIPESRLPAAVSALLRREGIREALILSTCNRVEVLVSAEDAADAKMIIEQFLADHLGFELGPYRHFFYDYHQQEAVHHLFRVAASLDSMVLGEPQILGQLKRAFQVANEAGALNGTLKEIVNQALAVAKRVRRETALGSAAVSVSYAAVELAKKIFGSLERKTIFIIGAGKMSELAARHLIRSGAGTIYVTNRTYERAVQLASAFRGTAVPFDQLFEYLAKADIVISSTGAPGYIVNKELAARALAARRNRPMFFVDIAVPRDIDPQVHELDNTFVYNVDDLQQVVESNKKQREREAVWAEEIVNDEVRKTMRRLASRDLTPTIVALEDRLNAIRQGEMERFGSRLAGLTLEQRQAIEALTRGFLNKILHGPISELKSGAGLPEQVDRVRLVQRIFRLAETQ
ncbi:Glutamyl-tRNA reductase [Acidobacteriia bacterium SbA2]|nr:Glutamyl-tRNA reductase [Acidobacteriia bacterium SbA2]